MVKTKTITAHIAARKPKLYTMIFYINGKYPEKQEAAYDLEDAIKKAGSVFSDGKYVNFTSGSIWWSFSISVDELRNKFKRAK